VPTPFVDIGDMVARIHPRGAEDRGFTLVELLIVLLIIGLLAAISIPLFANQQGRANDASAKGALRTARVAIEVYAVDHHDVYTGATAAGLRAIEPKLSESPADTLTVSGADSDGFTLRVTSPAGGRTYTVVRASGATTRSCSVPPGSDSGGCSGGTW
jgi:prepilin-type N-terminal cleavage/methylation domain-containing protein